MRVHACIKMLSDKTIQEILMEHARRLPKQNAPKNLAAMLCHDPYLGELWSSLHKMEQDAVRIFMINASKGFLRKKEWESIVQQKNPQLEFGLSGLRRLGLVYTVRKLWSEVGYLMPAEIRRALVTASKSQESDTIESNASFQEALSYYIPAGRGIHLDLFACLLFVRDHVIQLTQKRTIHRRTLQKLSPLFSIREEHIKGWYERLFPDEIRRNYSPAEAFILDLAIRLQLIKPEGKQLSLSYPEVKNFLSLDAKSRKDLLFACLSASYVPVEPWLEACWFEISTTRYVKWQPLAFIFSRLRSLGFTLPSGHREIVMEQILHPLLGLGMIEVGENKSELYWRIHPSQAASHTEDFWYVEPTGTVLASQSVSLQKLWELSRLAELEFTGEMIRSQLKPIKVQSYLSQGGTEQEIADFLQQSCPYPIPEAIREQIDIWAKEAKQIRMEQVIRVSTAHANLLEELKQIPLVQPFLIEVISATDFLIPMDQQEELIQTLKQCGFEPRQGKIEKFSSITALPDGLDHPAPDLDESLRTGLFSIPKPWDGYKIENVFPERPTESPKLLSLPKIWTQHLQSYHPQTLRDMLKRAEELKLTVLLQLTSGAELEGVAERVKVEMGYWTITFETGRRKQKIRLEEIKRIKLVLPDYI